MQPVVYQCPNCEGLTWQLGDDVEPLQRAFQVKKSRLAMLPEALQCLGFELDAWNVFISNVLVAENAGTVGRSTAAAR